MRAAVVLACVVLAAPSAHAETPRKIVEFSVRGSTKLTDQTAVYLSHYAIGDPITSADIAVITDALLSTELFTSVTVTLEDVPDGVRVVCTLDDKHSWIAAPTVFLLSGNQAFGVGFAENDFRGRNEKILLYGQLGTKESLFFGTFLNPSLDGTPISYRLDLYAYRRGLTEYTNPVGDARDASVARITTTTYLGWGGLVGYRFAWWGTADLRFRGAYVTYRNSHADDAAQTPLPAPETDGWDATLQPRLTLDARHHYFGLTWGPYFQLIYDHTIPGLDDFDYSSILFRGYYSWRLFSSHQLEIRSGGAIGTHLPLNEDFTLGGTADLRGYAVDRFRGDRRAFGRIEYSVPIVKWKYFAFRALGFWDSAVLGFHSPRTGPDRIYLPGQAAGVDRWRNDLGLGLRVYVKAIVLPLLGFDVGYGLEGHAPSLFFELGLTDF